MKYSYLKISEYNKFRGKKKFLCAFYCEVEFAVHERNKNIIDLFQLGYAKPVPNFHHDADFGAEYEFSIYFEEN